MAGAPGTAVTVVSINFCLILENVKGYPGSVWLRLRL